jgi:hypothetical protein
MAVASLGRSFSRVVVGEELRRGGPFFLDRPMAFLGLRPIVNSRFWLSCKCENYCLCCQEVGEICKMPKRAALGRRTGTNAQFKRCSILGLSIGAEKDHNADQVVKRRIRPLVQQYCRRPIHGIQGNSQSGRVEQLLMLE